jgi:sirohydrochlorin cobaltochelatase
MSWPPGECSLLLIGHGSGRPGGAAVTPERIAAAIRQDGRFAEVATAYLEQAPFAQGWRSLVGRPRVLVAPLLLSQGLHARQDLPALFGADAVLCPLLGNEPALVELVLDKVREALHPAP